MLFSIITATYNSEKTISNSLSSLNAQTCRDFEHVIIDGGSADLTLETVSKITTSTPKIISEKDDGLFDALNKGISLSEGDYIGFLHSDDEFADSRVLETIKNIIRIKEPDIIFGNLNYVNDLQKGKILRHWKAGSFKKEKLQFGWMPPHPTFFMKKNIYCELGGFDKSYSVSADYDAMLRYLLKDQLTKVYVDRVLVNMQSGGNSSRLGNVIPKMVEDYNILKKYGFRPLLGLIGKNVQKIKQIRF
jgi:glycosyltransferase